MLPKHIQESYDAIMNCFKTEQSCCIENATGTGKSWVISLVAEHFNKVLIVVPTRVIKKQFEDTGNPKYKVITYKQASRFKYSVGCDLIVFDECHRLGAKTWSRGYDLQLYNQYNTKILGTTATLTRYSDTVNVVDRFFKNKVYTFNLKEAVESQVVNPIKYVLGVSDYSESAKKFKKVYRDWKKCLNTPELIRKYIPKDTRNVYIFISQIRFINSLRPIIVNWFREAGFRDIEYYPIHSKLSNSEGRLKESINKSSKGIHLIVSVNQLTEGLHINGITTAIMLRGTSSNIIFSQQLGRTISINNTKEAIILDLVSNLHKVSKAREWITGLESKSNEFSGSKYFTLIDELKSIDDILERLNYNDRSEEYKEWCLTNSRRPTSSTNSSLHHWEYDHPTNPVVIEMREKFPIRGSIDRSDEYREWCLSNNRRPSSLINRSLYIWESGHKNHPVVIEMREKFPLVGSIDISKEYHEWCLSNNKRPSKMTNGSLYSWELTHKDHPIVIEMRTKFPVLGSIDKSEEYREWCLTNNRRPTEKVNSLLRNWEATHKDHPVVIEMREKFPLQGSDKSEEYREWCLTNNRRPSRITNKSLYSWELNHKDHPVVIEMRAKYSLKGSIGKSEKYREWCLSNNRRPSKMTNESLYNWELRNKNHPTVIEMRQKYPLITYKDGKK